MAHYNLEDNFGSYFNEYQIGDTYRHWPGKTITESDNNLFTLLVMNHNPLHIDEEYAKNSQHGKILVVGTLVFSLVAGMSVSDISGKAIANLDYESILHHAPVFIGDTIYAESEILDKKISQSKTDRGVIYVKTIGYNQSEKKVISFRRNVLIERFEGNDV
jgi:acyl dehydratase